MSDDICPDCGHDHDDVVVVDLSLPETALRVLVAGASWAFLELVDVDALGAAAVQLRAGAKDFIETTLLDVGGLPYLQEIIGVIQTLMAEALDAEGL